MHLREGTLLARFPKVINLLKIGIGQSIGGCMIVIQQGQYHCYDGIAVLGYSAIHTHPPIKPGSVPLVVPWWPRDGLDYEPLVHSTLGGSAFGSGTEMSWGFHYDDIDPELTANDLARFERPVTEFTVLVKAECPPWGSMTYPTRCALSCLTPGSIAPEAAAVNVPVLVAMGERDVIGDPKGEARAYQSTPSIDLFICPRMGHMHNFASTRELFWRRLETWSEWVREVKKTAL